MFCSGIAITSNSREENDIINQFETERAAFYQRMDAMDEEEEDWEQQDRIMKQKNLLAKNISRENRRKIINNLSEDMLKELFMQG